MLNDRFPDLPIFNAAKLFSLKYFPTNEEDRTRATDVWLERLMEKFVPFENDRDACRAEMLEFVETIRYKCPKKHAMTFMRHCHCMVVLWSRRQIGQTSSNGGKKCLSYQPVLQYAREDSLSRI